MSQAETSERRNGDTPIGYLGQAALRREQCYGFAQSNAPQWLGKHSRNNKYATIGCPVLGNIAVTCLYNNSGNRRRRFLCGPCQSFITDTENLLRQLSTESRTMETGEIELESR
jgi:hypothetical protein